jgi:hypothetical protein
MAQQTPQQQPPASGSPQQPPSQSSDQKSWVREIIKNVILLVVGGLVTLAVTQLTKDPPPAKPSSANAAIVLDTVPVDGKSLELSGTGWDGDNSVEVSWTAISGGKRITAHENHLLPNGDSNGGSFFFQADNAADMPGDYTVIVRGEQSNHEEQVSYTIP